MIPNTTMNKFNPYIKKILLDNLMQNFNGNNDKQYLRLKKLSQKRKKIILSMQSVYIPKIPKIENYLITILDFTDETFHSHFRMSKSVFYKLKEELNPLWTNAKRGRPGIPLEEALYITLWALGNKNCYREIGDRFNKSISTVFDILIKTCKKIVELLSKFVKWPSSNEAIDSIVSKFNYLRGPNSFPNVVGAIDSTHIKIPSPSDDSSSYYNRKGFASMVLQATCDSDRAFTNIFFGWPGRCHDAYVFKESELGKKLINGTLKLPPDIHLIGDSAYPLSTYLLVPYKDNGSLSEMQKQFNYRLSSSRVIIEQAFGTLKAKFRILESLNFKKIENIRHIVLACVVLHNFIIFKGEPFLGSLQDRTESASYAMGNMPGTTSLSAGRSKRDLLASLLYA